MLLVKKYKDAPGSNFEKVTNLDREFEILRSTFKEVSPLMLDGSVFETNWAYYRVMNQRDFEGIKLNK